MRRALLAVVAALLFASACGDIAEAAAPNRAAVLRACAHPTKLTGPEDGVAFPGGLRVNQDQWSGAGKQRMSVCSSSDWTAVATQSGQPETGVKTYPSTVRTYTDWLSPCAHEPRVDSFHKLTGRWAESAPTGASFDFAWDIFANNTCGKPLTEIMVLPHWTDVSFPTPQATPTIDGVKYDLTYSLNSGRFIQFRRQSQTTAGSVNLHAIFRYLELHGLLAKSDTVQFVATGYEILTTFGKPLPFKLTDFSLDGGPSTKGSK